MMRPTKSSVKEAVLSILDDEKWMTAAEISRKTGFTPVKIAAIIRSYMQGKSVEVMRSHPPDRPGLHQKKYRRMPFI